MERYRQEKTFPFGHLPMVCADEGLACDLRDKVTIVGGTLATVAGMVALEYVAEKVASVAKGAASLVTDVPIYF